MNDLLIPLLQKIHLHKQSSKVVLSYREEEYQLSCEFLRVMTPSAEARGHGNPALQAGKKHIKINHIEKIGNYGLKFVFDDGYNTGIYTWKYLYMLCMHQKSYWHQYLDDIRKACLSRDPDVSVIKTLDNR